MVKERNQDLKILVVDDSEFSLNSVVSILKNEGFNVVGQATSAEEAIQMAANTSANLCIIDVVMPEKSGIELAEALADNTFSSGKTISIIMMSSLALENIIIESISKGAFDFLEKPFDSQDLIRSVEKAERDLGEKD